MADSIEWVGGVPNLPNAGLLSARPTASRFTFDLPYWATDTSQLFMCVKTLEGNAPTYAWELVSSAATQSGNLFGLLSARPVAAAANAGAFYYATDNGELYQNIQSSNGVYEWLAYPTQGVPSQLTVWAGATLWGINPSTGSDTNVGSSVSPLKTWAEFRRRILAAGGFAQGLGNVIVQIVGNIPASDPVSIVDIVVPVGTALIVRGTATTLFSGTVGVVVAQNPATNTQWSFTDASIPVSWTASGLINQRGRITSAGARIGSTFWAVKDLTGKAARISWLTLTPVTFPFAFGGTFPTITAGDTYAMESLSTIDTIVAGGSAVPMSSDGASIKIFFQDVSIINNPFEALVGNVGSTIGFVNCLLQWPQSDNEDYFGCQIVNINLQSGQNISVSGGYTQTGFGLVEAGASLVLSNFLVQGTELDVFQGQVFCNKDVGIFDSGAEGWLVQQGQVFAGASAHMYGSGNATFGINCQSQSSVVYANKPTVTGTTNDTKVGGVALAYAAIPVITAANGAAIVLNA